MKKLLLLTKTLLAAALLCVGQNAWAIDYEWQDVKSWNLTGLTSTELSNYAWLTNQNNQGKTFYINTATGQPFSVSDTESALYGLKFEGNYNDGVKGGFNTTSADDAASRGFIFGGGAGKITIPNLKAGQRVVVTLKDNQKISSSELSDITVTGSSTPYTSTGIVNADGNVVIARSGSTTYCQTVKVQKLVGTELYDFNKYVVDKGLAKNAATELTRLDNVIQDVTGTVSCAFNGRFSTPNGNIKLRCGGTNATDKGLQNAVSETTLTILNLKQGDIVTIKTGYGDTRIEASDKISPVVSEQTVISDKVGNTETSTSYTMTADGEIVLTLEKWAVIMSISIKTETPVLSAPTVSFNSMVESEGLYYPKYTFSSADDGVKFYDKDGNDITSGYTFTSAGSQTVYAGKDGRTNSAKVSFSADKVGMILANSVNCKALDGTIDYSLGKVFSSGRFDNINEQGTAFWKQLVPGLEFNSTFWYAASTNGIYAGSGSRTVSCTVLNDNRVATFKHYDYDISAEKYDYLTSSSNSTTIKRQSTPAKNDYLREYNLYVNPSEEVSVTIGSTGYSTFSSPVPLNFAGIDGLTAYVATSVADGTVNLTSVTTAPANTGLVLKGTAEKTYNIPVTNAAVAPASNLLVGCIVETVVAKDATSGFNNYVLAIEGGVAKFQSLVDNGATIPAGKAFLKNGAVGPSARSMGISFGDITGINQIDNGQLTMDNSLPVKRIVNGKLIIEKKGVKFNAAGAKLY